MSGKVQPIPIFSTHQTSTFRGPHGLDHIGLTDMDKKKAHPITCVYQNDKSIGCKKYNMPESGMIDHLCFVAHGYRCHMDLDHTDGIEVDHKDTYHMDVYMDVE